MPKLTKDPLLGSARALLAIIIGLFIFVMAMLGIGIGAMLTVQRGTVMAKLAEAGAPPAAYWVVLAAAALLGLLVYLGYRFIRELYRIVNSVDEGDPFRPDNADRLARMGWLALAGQVLSIPIGAAVRWVTSFNPEIDVNIDVGLSGGAILLILTLFILARVFRQGTAMREELEGTV